MISLHAACRVPKARSSRRSLAACLPLILSAGLAGWAGCSLAAGAPPPPPPSLNPMASYPKSELKAFVAEPLFDPSRRLAPPAVVAALPPAAPVIEQPPTLELVGVVQGERAEAIVQEGGRTRVLRTGDHIGNWFVEVLPVSLRLHRGLRAYDYAMFRQDGLVGPTAVDSGGVVASQPVSVMPAGSVRPGE